MENAHTKGPAECLSYFGVNENTGLSPEQFKKNLDKYGYNGESRWGQGRGGVGGHPQTKRMRLISYKATEEKGKMLYVCIAGGCSSCMCCLSQKLDSGGDPHERSSSVLLLGRLFCMGRFFWRGANNSW